ncbi:DUF4360 domain-containing protein [Sorangium sp. So ce1036]|uniref:DUF4360 domain-containing protein n=1 Tax=Sorangium sp. So ce1036 TaxID=3133328 RepID=UPI003F06C576
MRRSGSRGTLVLAAAAAAALSGRAAAQVAEGPVAPPPGSFAVEKVIARGAACPGPETVTVAFAPDGQALVVDLDPGLLTVLVGPGSTAAGRTCQMQLDLRIPLGHRVALRRATYRGVAYLQAGVTGRHMTRTWFLGTRAPARMAELHGPHRGRYRIGSDFGPEAVYSLCNLDRPLFLHTTVAASNLLEPRSVGLMSAGGPSAIVYELTWSRCSR